MFLLLHLTLALPHRLTGGPIAVQPFRCQSVRIISGTSQLFDETMTTKTSKSTMSTSTTKNSVRLFSVYLFIYFPTFSFSSTASAVSEKTFINQTTVKVSTWKWYTLHEHSWFLSNVPFSHIKRMEKKIIVTHKMCFMCEKLSKCYFFFFSAFYELNDGFV